MNGFKAFRYYLALKLHFNNDKFNVFENKGNIKYSHDAFNARNDKFIFEKLARRFDTDQELIQFYVANFIYGNDNMIYGVEEAEEFYLHWKKVKESITKVFSDDLNVLLLEAEKNNYSIQQIFNCANHEFPVLVKLYLGKRVSPQTISILGDFYDRLFIVWKNDTHISLVLETEIRRLTKLKGFVKYDKEKLYKIFNEFIANFDVGLYK